MSKEALEIRSEIDRLKLKLLELEKDNIEKEEEAQLCAPNV
ncbi:hypothetical protein [Sedimentibacter sp. zth1]|nr:hypothetical protein [Sedimentibacter sp. zth1]